MSKVAAAAVAAASSAHGAQLQSPEQSGENEVHVMAALKNDGERETKQMRATVDSTTGESIVTTVRARVSRPPGHQASTPASIQASGVALAWHMV